MVKNILITGSTDGIGLLAAKKLAATGHTILVHGRNEERLAKALKEVGPNAKGYLADLSHIADVKSLSAAIAKRHTRLDVLINNAGVLKAPNPILPSGLDIRFMVNTLAPFILTGDLLRLVPKQGRVINVSSAAQAPVDLQALQGERHLEEMNAYAQSKLAITLWTIELAKIHKQGPVFSAVNPGSLLASKMVKEGFGVDGKDIMIGANILCDAAIGERFEAANGLYFDNDSGAFVKPHPAVFDVEHVKAVMRALNSYALNPS